MLVGFAALIEMLYHLQLAMATGTTTRFLGIDLDTRGAGSWLGSLAVALAGFAAFEFLRRRFAQVWGTVQAEIEATIAARERA